MLKALPQSIFVVELLNSDNNINFYKYISKNILEMIWLIIVDLKGSIYLFKQNQPDHLVSKSHMRK
jgi:hypothetical protein